MQDSIITSEMIPDLSESVIIDRHLREVAKKNRLYIKELKKLRKTLLKANVVSPADLLAVLHLCNEILSKTSAIIKPPKLKKFNNKELLQVISYIDECLAAYSR